MADKKYLDQKLAEKLFPVYCEGGGKVVTAYVYCQKEGIEISKPTLGKMAVAFYWKTKYEEQQRNEFSSNTGNDLGTLLNEVTAAKNGLKNKTDPESLRVFGTFISKIVDIKKLQIAEQAVDKDRLLIEALKAVVEFFREQGEEDMAKLLGENLEVISEKVKEKW